MDQVDVQSMPMPNLSVAASDGAAANTDMKQFVAFSIGERNFCVDIMEVREIRAWAGATSLPNAPEYVRGVINLRGNIVPVIDLRARFGHGLTDAESSHVVVIVMIEEQLHGLLVDSVSDILNVADKDIAEVPSSDLGTRANYLDGIITEGDGMVAIISLDRLVTRELTAAA